jgi:hypothetical protein
MIQAGTKIPLAHTGIRIVPSGQPAFLQYTYQNNNYDPNHMRGYIHAPAEISGCPVRSVEAGLAVYVAKPEAVAALILEAAEAVSQ